MAVEVIPGVWWFERTRGCNAYLARAEDGSFVLVDPGFRGNAAAVVEQARRIAAGAPVTHILLTHGHADHASAAGAVADALGARVTAGAGDAEPDGAGGWRMRAHFRRGRSRGNLAWIRVDDRLEGRREVAPGIEAVPTPGHTPGSLCYVARGLGVSFVGDLVIAHRDGIARSLPAANGDDARYLATLRAFAEEATPAGLAGHGHPIGEGFAEALRALAATPRERNTPRVALRRARRLARFATWVSMMDQPPRRPAERRPA